MFSLNRSGIARKRFARFFRKLNLQPLELRCTPATISGQAFYDVNANGNVDSGEAGLSGVTVFLDANNNGLLDGASAQNFGSGSVNLSIPDNTTAGVSSNLAVSGVIGNIADINVTLSITHPWDGDLVATLTAPDSTVITLFSRPGGTSNSGDNFTNTVLDDQATNSISAITSAGAPYTASFKPSPGTLATFNGKSANGTWTLNVSDRAKNDTGTFNSWSLQVTPAGGESSTTTNASGNYSFTGLAAGSYNVSHTIPSGGYVQTTPGGDGRHHVTLAAGDSFTGNFGDRLPPATITGLVFNDTNGNGTKESGEVVLSGVTVFIDNDGSGTLTAGDTSTTTDAGGNYSINNLVPNKSYKVYEVLPGGFTHIAPLSSGLTASTNINVNKQTGEQSETAVAIDPTNPNRVFASSNNNTGSGMMGSYSTDGGATWTARYFGISGTDGLTTSTGDPNNTFDHFGNLWDVSLASSGTATIVYRSTDGGKTFTNFQSISSSTDQPSISIQPSSTAGRDLIALVYNQASGQWASYLEVDASGPIGTFSTPVLIPGSNSGTVGEYSDVAIGPNGEVAVAYQNSSGQGPDTIWFNLDPDGIGASAFGSKSQLTTTNVGGFDYITPQPNRSVDAEIALKWDISNGPHRGRLYAMYTDENTNESNDTDIMLRYSDNKGTTWSNPVPVNDDSTLIPNNPNATSRSQFLPRMDLDPTTGYLAFSWYDARNDATNAKSEIWATASFDGGATFLPNIKLSSGQSTPIGGNDYGDYSGLSFYGGKFIACWVDNSNSTGDNPSGTASHDIYTARVTVANNQKYWLVSTLPNTTYSGKDFAIQGANPPLTVTINQASGQADPTNGSTINYTVVFNQTVSDFATGDVSLSGTAGATTAVVTGSGTTYNVAVSGMTGTGTVIASLAAGVANGAGGANQGSTSTDNSVTFDATLPNAASSPSGITVSGASSYQFTVTFSDDLAVNIASLDNNDVRVTGPGGFDVPATFVSVDVGTNGTPRVATYKVTPPGGVWDSADNGSYSVVLQSSQVSDTATNVVGAGTLGSFNVNIAPLTVTIDQKVGQADPTNASTINFTVVFSSSVSDFTTGDVSLSGTAGATTAVVTGSGTTYNVAVSGMTGSGIVVASLAAGVASSSGNPNQVSTGTDNTVTYDGTLPTAAASGPPNVTTSGATSGSFTVTFSDNLAVSVASLDNNDIHVTGPGGFDAAATFVGVDVNTDGTPRVATYTFTPPGGSWDFADNGAYSVVMQSNQVNDIATNSVAAGAIGNFNVSITPLTVTIDQAVGQADPTNNSTINFTVVFNQSVSDFATGDVSIGGTAGATTAIVTGSGTTYNVAVSGMTGSGTVIASIGAGVATWPDGANQPSTSTDNTVIYDVTLPTAASTPANVKAYGASAYQFTVIFSDNVAIDVSTLDNNDVRVTGPGGFDVPATFVNVDFNTSGTPRVATYTITPPGGDWDMADNGAYSVVMQSGQVVDTAGNVVGNSTLGSFSVSVPLPPTVTGVTFGDGTNQRSLVKQIVVNFSESVTFTPNVVSAFTLTRTGTSGTTGNVTLTATPSTGSASSVTITFSGSLTEFDSLVDGYYDFKISAAQVSGAGGPLDGNNDTLPGGSYSVTGTTANKFFRLFGDSDGDATTTLSDFAAFRSVFNLGSNTTFDFDNDGNVGLSDFAQFRARFNLSP